MGRLRVSVSAPAAAARTGHGRVWERGSGRAGQLVRVVSRRPDVWLVDGHGELPSTDRPIVAVVHEAPWEDPRTLPHLHPDFVAALRARLADVRARAARIVVPSQAGAAQVGAPNVDVVPYGVDARRVRAGHGPRGEHVLFVGTAHPRKNLEALREAMRGDRAARCAWCWPRRPTGRTLPSCTRGRRGRPAEVVQAPGDAELAREMASAAVFCLPSFSEGFGLPALEAMACAHAGGRRRRRRAARGGRGRGRGRAPRRRRRSPTGCGARWRTRRCGARGRARALAFPWSRTAAGWLESLRRAVESAAVTTLALEACPACGAREAEAAELGLRRCAACGTVYARAVRRPGRGVRRGLLRGRRGSPTGSTPHTRASRRSWREVCARRCAFARAARRRARLAAGRRLRRRRAAAVRASARGWRAAGAEPMAEAAELARARAPGRRRPHGPVVGGRLRRAVVRRRLRVPRARAHARRARVPARARPLRAARRAGGRRDAELRLACCAGARGAALAAPAPARAPRALHAADDASRARRRRAASRCASRRRPGSSTSTRAGELAAELALRARAARRRRRSSSRCTGGCGAGAVVLAAGRVRG